MVRMQVIGHLGRDCTTNTVNGKNVINFAVAHSEKYKDSTGNLVEKTVWVDCAYWTDRTGIAPYLKKGTQVYAEGIPDVRAYTTNEGRQGATLTLRVLQVDLLGSRRDGGTGGTEPTSNNNNNNYNSNTPAANPQRNAVNTVQADNNMGEPSDDLPF